MELHLAVGLAHTPLPQRRRLKVVTDTFTIGRSKDCDLTISHPSMSRQHCRFQRADDGGWQVSDMGSSVGTQRNGHPVKGLTKIAENDVLRCGEVEITVLQCKNNDQGERRGVTQPRQQPAINDDQPRPEGDHRARKVVKPRVSQGLLAATRAVDSAAKEGTRRQRIIRPSGTLAEVHPNEPTTVEMIVGDLNYDSKDLAHHSDFYDLSDTD